MGAAAYYRGNKAIHDSIYGRDLHVARAAQPRLATWGDKTLAAAAQKARRCLSYMTSRGHALSVDELADMVQSDSRWTRATCESAARAAVAEPGRDE